MEFTLLTIMLILCSCLLFPLIVVTWYIINRYLTQQSSEHNKTITSSAPTVSTAITIDVPVVVIQPETPPLASSLVLFSPRRTPFGTRRTSMDFAASLKASLSKGPESLAAALDGVLALHNRLEKMRHQRNDSVPEHDHRNTLTLNPSDLGQISYM